MIGKKPQAQWHARLGASSMERWEVCPGSIRSSRGIPRTTSTYASEGTAAHELAGSCLQNGRNAASYIDHVIVADGREFIVDDEMAEAVQVYLDFVRSQWIAPDPGVLVVCDYKHGSGVAVEVVKNQRPNRQLMYYAFGALYDIAAKPQQAAHMFVESTFKLAMFRPDLGGTCDVIIHPGGPIRRVRLAVVQPRCGHPDGPVRTYEIDVLDMADFHGDLLEAAARTDDPRAPLVSGDHCKFCPAAAICPELSKATAAVIKFQDLTPAAYDVNKLAEGLHLIPKVKAQLAAMESFAYAEANRGVEIPGWKIVDKRKTRKWRDEQAAAGTLRRAGVQASDIFKEPKMKSPAQIEELIGKKRVKQILEGEILSESSGTKLTPVSDPAPAAGLLTFSNLQEK